ncbi:MAG: hypothetical protein P0Y53_23195 [Candidatus Pseudobacter hemicellulosilyticus]|uniref:DNA polymerase III psi subunit n=1 Tax=Candidatus Pseudobacter hemicellulosilyticus TaxID=3121375 RepID=A0AAJ5WQH5_9BACT|nr:MAG: hypothetical protein P0Y53_23195 [Pseudobacter sp.]
MPLDKTLLPASILAGLYKQPLIVTGEPMPIRELEGMLPETDATPVAAEASASGYSANAGTTVSAAQTPAEPAIQPANGTNSPTSNAGQLPAEGHAYKFLGKNLQRVLVIVRAPGEAFLPEEELQLLTKMLGACKLNLGDVAIVNDASTQVEMSALKTQLNPVKALLFGIEPQETGLPLSFPPFKEQEYAGCTYLHAPALTALNQPTETGKQLKTELWTSLKKMFGL